jgi:hypothetical protein
MFSQKFIQDGARRDSSPRTRGQNTRGCRTDAHGMIQNSSIKRSFGKVLTSMPPKEPPPPHSEYRRSGSPLCCIAATSRCRKVSVAFGKVVKR